MSITDDPTTSALPLEAYPVEARQRLGRLLKERRPQLDPRYRVRRVFAAERGLHDKSVQEIEKAYRANFSVELLAAIETAYALAPGSLREVLEDPALTGFPRAPRADVAVRLHQSQVDDHREKAARALECLRAKTHHIEDYLRDSQLPSASGAARQAAVDLAELVEALSALRALAEVGFLADRLDTPTSSEEMMEQ